MQYSKGGTKHTARRQKQQVRLQKKQQAMVIFKKTIFDFPIWFISQEGKKKIKNLIDSLGRKMNRLFQLFAFQYLYFNRPLVPTDDHQNTNT